MEQKRCISSLTLAELTAELKALGQPGFRAKQIFHWVHQKLVTEFSAMTDQPKTLLAKLEETFYIAAPQIERRQEAKDGTVKYLLRMADGNCIETVVMRYHYGNTVCVSTQVGCRMGCRFCASTQAGRVRNLEAGEICSEIYTAQKDIGERISHIVPCTQDRPAGGEKVAAHPFHLAARTYQPDPQQHDAGQRCLPGGAADPDCAPVSGDYRPPGQL